MAQVNGLGVTNVAALATSLASGLTSTQVGGLSTTTLVNLAYICAQGGYNTLMIDGDLRRPKLHTFFDINNSVGLTNYLTTALINLGLGCATAAAMKLCGMPNPVLWGAVAGLL